MNQAVIIMSESTVLLDEEQISNLKELFGEGFEGIVSTYFEDFESKSQALDAALKSKDFDVVLKLAHSLKGSSLNMGATGLANVCFQVEMASKSSNFQRIEQQNLELQKLYPQTKAAFIQIINNK